MPGRVGRVRDVAVTALDHVSVGVAAGESVGIIGPNAAGKSTLLGAIAGIVGLDEGSILTTGRCAPLLGLAPGFEEQLTGRENLWSVMRLFGLTPVDIGPMETSIIDFAGLAESMDVPVKHYSSGMVARLALAIALHLPAEVLLVDELLSLGDEEFRRRVVEEVRGLHEAGRTVVLVSHELQLVEQLCERVIRLEAGCRIDDGPTDDVIGRYAGRSWAAGVHDVSGGARFSELSVRRSSVPIGGTVSFSGTVTVDEPLPHARLELSVRVSPGDRSVVMSAAQRDLMSIFKRTLSEPGTALASVGVVAYDGTVELTMEGDADLVIAVIDGFDGRVLAETWHSVTVGDPGTDRLPRWTFDLGWAIDRARSS